MRCFSSYTSRSRSSFCSPCGGECHSGLDTYLGLTNTRHVSIFKDRFNFMIWACCIIWAADRLLRFLRIISFNLKFWSTIAEATYSPESNIVRLTVDYSSSLYHPQPGRYYYIYVLSQARFWESHPFTMAYATAPAMARQQSEREPLLQTSSPLIEPTKSSLRDRPSTMTFVIRPFDGFTTRLRHSAASKPRSLRVLIEGPYGHCAPLHRYDSVLFMVGGSGIVAPLAHLETLAHASRPGLVRIVWAVREASFATQVLRHDIGDLIHRSSLVLDVYVTQSGTASSEGLPKWVRFQSGKPETRVEVQDAACKAGNGSLAVIACGPPKLADHTRMAVVEVLKQADGKIDYFEEAFKW